MGAGNVVDAVLDGLAVDTFVVGYHAVPVPVLATMIVVGLPNLDGREIGQMSCICAGHLVDVLFVVWPAFVVVYVGVYNIHRIATALGSKCECVHLSDAPSPYDSLLVACVKTILFGSLLF